MLLALLQELAEALFLLGLNARQFLQLCSFGGGQSVEVADFAFGSLSLALFLAMMPWQMWICMLSGLVFTMAERVRSRYRALASMSPRMGVLSGMALSCSKQGLADAVRVAVVWAHVRHVGGVVHIHGRCC